MLQHVYTRAIYIQFPSKSAICQRYIQIKSEPIFQLETGKKTSIFFPRRLHFCIVATSVYNTKLLHYTSAHSHFNSPVHALSTQASVLKAYSFNNSTSSILTITQRFHSSAFQVLGHYSTFQRLRVKLELGIWTVLWRSIVYNWSQAYWRSIVYNWSQAYGRFSGVVQ